MILFDYCYLMLHDRKATITFQGIEKGIFLLLVHSMWKPEYKLNMLYRAVLSQSQKKRKLEAEESGVDLYARRRESPNNGRNIMLLAMHYAPESRNIESDTNRINAFLKDDWSVCSVDLSGFQNSYGHISSNFKTMRDINRIIKRHIEYLK